MACLSDSYYDYSNDKNKQASPLAAEADMT